MPERIAQKLTSESALGKAIMFFAIAVTLAVCLATWALIKAFETSDQNRKLIGRVGHIEKPTPEETRRGLDQAIKNLTPQEVQAIIDKLPASTRRKVRQHSHGGTTGTGGSQGGAGTPNGTSAPSIGGQGQAPTAHTPPRQHTRTVVVPSPPQQTTTVNNTTTTILPPVPAIPSPCLVQVLNLCVPNPRVSVFKFP